MQIDRDKISVIIPAYNAANTIGKCLESILGGVWQCRGYCSQ